MNPLQPIFEMKISGVLPIHNEEQLLIYSLPSIRLLSFDELIVVLDRCIDGSERLIREYVPNAKIVYKEKQTWMFTKAGESFQKGFDEAKNGLVFALGADLIVTEQALNIVKREFSEDASLGSVFFGFTQRSDRGVLIRIHEEYYNILKRILDKLMTFKTMPTTGVYCFKKSLAKLRDVPAEYNDLHLQLKQKGYNLKYIPDAKIVHLRAGLTKQKQVWHGKVRAIYGESILKTLLHSVLHLKFWTLITFLTCRRHACMLSKGGMKYHESASADL